MPKITSILAAQSAWEEFSDKYNAIVEKLACKNDAERVAIERAKKRRTERLAQKNAEEFEQALFKRAITAEQLGSKLAELVASVRLNAAAKKIQQLVRRVYDGTAPSSRVAVTHKGSHSAQVRHLLNRQPVKKQLNAAMQQSLLQALQLGEGELFEKLFRDPLLPETALALFDAGKITPQQMFSILARHQMLPDFPLIARFRMFTDSGEISEKGQWLIDKVIKPRYHAKKFTDEHRNAFIYLLKTLPVSEQFFDMTTQGSLEPAKTPRSLLQGLIDTDTVLEFVDDKYDADVDVDSDAEVDSDVDSNMEDDELQKKPLSRGLVSLSVGMQDALNIAYFGLDRYIMGIPQLGIFSPEDIIRGVSEKIRPTAMAFPDTLSHNNKDIHGYSGGSITNHVHTEHDHYHRDRMSADPTEIHNIRFRIARLLTDVTKFKLSLEIWEFYDSDYTYCFDSPTPQEMLARDKLSSQEITELFCTALYHGTETFAYYESDSNGGYLVRVDRNRSLTNLGVIFMIDLIKNKDSWLKDKLEPQFLTKPLKDYFTAVQGIYKYLEKDVSLIQILKYNLYEQLTRREKASEFPAISGYIDENSATFVKSLTFSKSSKRNLRYVSCSKRNMLYVSYEGSKLNDEAIQKIIKRYFDAKSLQALVSMKQDSIPDKTSSQSQKEAEVISQQLSMTG